MFYTGVLTGLRWKSSGEIVKLVAELAAINSATSAGSSPLCAWLAEPYRGERA